MIRRLWWREIVLVVGVALFSPAVYSYSGGVDSSSWQSTAGCNSCHTGGTAPTVQFLANGAAVTSINVRRDSFVDLLLSISGGQTHAGFNVSPSVSSSVATLSSGLDAGVQTVTNGSIGRTEVTHTAPRAYDPSGAATFAFRLTPSATAGCNSTMHLIGWGNSVARDGGTSGNKASKATLYVTINCPAAVASVTLSPNAAPVGGAVEGTVTLTAEAPAEGFPVTLSSSSSAATVPASITVPAGAKVQAFTVSPSVGGKTTITATGGGRSATANLSVMTGLRDFMVSPTAISLREGITLGIALSAPSLDPVVVALASSDPMSFEVPAMVTIPAGATTAKLPLSQLRCAQPGTIAFRASYGGVVKEASVSIR